MPTGGHVNVALQVFRVGQLLGRALDQALAPSGLDGRDFAVLSVLRLVAPIQSTALADVLRMPPTSLSTRLAALERRGLVRRRRGDVDGRARLVELTEVGDERVRACFPAFGALVRSVEQRLDSRLADVQNALADLEQALEERVSATTHARR